MRSNKERNKRRVGGDVYVMSIKLPRQLVDVIDEQADRQSRTTASLIRQALLEKFQRVA